MNLCQVLIVGVLLGAAGDPGAKGTAADVLTEPRWEIAPEVSYFQYEEPGVMKDKGILYGVAGAYTRSHDESLLRPFLLIDAHSDLLPLDNISKHG